MGVGKAQERGFILRPQNCHYRSFFLSGFCVGVACERVCFVQWLPQPCSVAISTMFSGYLKESDAYVFVIYAWQCQDYLIFVSLSTCLKYQKVWQKKS